VTVPVHNGNTTVEAVVLREVTTAALSGRLTTSKVFREKLTIK